MAGDAKPKPPTKPAKRDLYREDIHLYRPRTEPEEVNVPPMNYLTVEGHGEPGSELFGGLLGALYNAAYTIKFGAKAEGRDFKVTGLEGLWWVEGGEDIFASDRQAWLYLLMLRVPEFVGKRTLADAKRAVELKKDVPHIDEVKLETIREGRCVQVMHVGPYSEEGPTIEKLHSFAAERGFEPSGRHHEVYLSDPRRVAPQKLRTIIRQPVRKKRAK